MTLLLAAMLLFTVAFAEGNDKITLTEETGEIVHGVLTMAKSKGLDLAGSSGYIMAPSVIDKGEMGTTPSAPTPSCSRSIRKVSPLSSSPT